MATATERLSDWAQQRSNERGYLASPEHKGAYLDGYRDGYKDGVDRVLESMNRTVVESPEAKAGKE